MKVQTLFNHLDNLTIHKKPWEDTYEFTSQYSPYMINLFIGLQDVFLPIIEQLNLTKNLPDEVHYNFLKMYLPKKKIYFKYISKDNSRVTELKAIATYFEVSIIEAKEYIEFLSDSDIDEIMEANGEPKIKKRKTKR